MHVHCVCLTHRVREGNKEDNKLEGEKLNLQFIHHVCFN